MSITPVTLTSTRFRYNFSISSSVAQKEINLVQTYLDRFFDVIGEDLGRNLIPSGMLIKLEQNLGNNFRLPYQICLDPRGLTDWTVTHELSHALDASYGWNLSRQMRSATHSGFPARFLHKLYPHWKLFWYRVGSPPPPCGVDKNFNSLEDFAEAVTAYIFPEEAYARAVKRGYPYEKWGYSRYQDTPRGQFIGQLIVGRELKTPS